MIADATSDPTEPHAANMAAASPAANSTVSPSAAARSIVIPEGELIILRIKPSLWMLATRVWVVVFIGVLLTFHLLDAWLGFTSRVITRLPIVNWTLSHAISRLGVALLIVSAGVVIWRFLEWWNKTYVLTDRRIVVQTGVLRQTIIDAPLRRIQHVSLHRGVEERALSIGTLVFSTAGPAGEFAWLQIAHPEQRLRIVRETLERYARGGPDGVS